MHCLLGVAFLNSQQINRINAVFRKARRFWLCSSTCLCDVSEYLRLIDNRLFNRIQSHYHCLSHLLPPENTTLAYVLEVTVIHSLYVQITYVNSQMLILFSLIINSVFYYCIYCIILL